MTIYDELVLETLALCREIENSPQARLEVRQAFYKKYGYKEQNGLSYGDSELAFLKWEIRRGVLNPLNDSEQAGSPWWRDVNLNFIYYSELAGKMFEHQVTSHLTPMPVQKWLTYLAQPCPESWYQAHNSSILAGYQKCLEDGRNENDVEQVFLNIVLYRLMFAQALVEDATIFGELGAAIADPRGFAVAFITHLPSFYPPHYPLTEADLPIIEGKERYTLTGEKVGYTEEELEKLAQDIQKNKHIDLDITPVYILDSLIIKPHLTELYRAAAAWNNSPFLPQYLKDKEPCYPYPTEAKGFIPPTSAQ